MTATNVFNLPQPNPKLQCTKCGATVEAACKCGVGYKPAREIAMEALKAHPEKSNRAIAKEHGISDYTVRKERKKVSASFHAPQKKSEFLEIHRNSQGHFIKRDISLKAIKPPKAEAHLAISARVISARLMPILRELKLWGTKTPARASQDKIIELTMAIESAVKEWSGKLPTKKEQEDEY